MAKGLHPASLYIYLMFYIITVNRIKLKGNHIDEAYPAANTIRRITSCQYFLTAPIRTMAMLNTNVHMVSSLTL